MKMDNDGVILTSNIILYFIHERFNFLKLVCLLGNTIYVYMQ